MSDGTRAARVAVAVFLIVSLIAAKDHPSPGSAVKAVLLLPGVRESIYCGETPVEFNYRDVSAARPETPAPTTAFDHSGRP